MAVYYNQVSHISPEVVPLIDAKKQLKMEDLGTFDDELIQDCIDAAIDECENYINKNIKERKFVVQSSSWLLQGYEFKQQHVQAITKITYKPLDGSADVVLENADISEFMELLAFDGYQHINYKGVQGDTSNLPDLAEDTFNAVTFEITVGYPIGTVPFGLLQAVKLLVSDNYNFRGDRDKKYQTASRIKLEPYKYYQPAQ